MLPQQKVSGLRQTLLIHSSSETEAVRDIPLTWLDIKCSQPIWNEVGYVTTLDITTPYFRIHFTVEFRQLHHWWGPWYSAQGPDYYRTGYKQHVADSKRWPCPGPLSIRDFRGTTPLFLRTVNDVVQSSVGSQGLQSPSKVTHITRNLKVSIPFDLKAVKLK